MEGNIFAFAMLIIWPLISIRLYQTQTIQNASFWTIVGGFMTLPVRTEVDLPLIPALGKHSIPVVAAIVGCWLVKGRRIKYFANKGWLKFLVLLMIIAPFITVMLNGDRVIVGGDFIQGLTLHDGLSAVINQLLLITPFFMGKQFFRTYEDHLLIFKSLVVAGLIYSIPMLFEIRMSPQLHSWLYGYFPHEFVQQMRAGGFRPVVFMGHGLLVAFFTVVVLLSSTVLWKNNEKIRQFSATKLSYFFIILLFLCKSMASLMYGLFAVLMIKKTSYKVQLRMALILAILAVSYPMLSILNIFPHQQLSDLAVEYMGEERAQSLTYRFDNEKVLLDHGRKRFFFGWGGWGRNRVYNEETGKDETVTDGRWIITFGTAGWLGFIAEFGFLLVSVLQANKAAKIIKLSTKELTLLAAHALLVSFIMIDQLPNASFAPWLWLLVGILLGRSEDIMNKNQLQRNKPIITQ
ncbi:hypothetical protein AU255_03795 [Methyloprofundus sedimenti]|uniref:O-antigen polymerase n=1 Tax=Methyloprofundus sedimenti TaxID=1420851 RepID=A0A1V8M648_9GAMM|nr:hypothetical protein [Methyloprofundus sedimenti]OQK17031.1 hypothetical protein AU255_03795 [Methyloprofundus sedimenti]